MKTIRVTLLICLVVSNILAAQTQFSDNLDDYTFDLSSLFENDDDFYKSKSYIENKVYKLKTYNNSNIQNKDTLLNALNLMYNLRLRATKMYQYGFLKEKINSTSDNNNLKSISDGMLSLVESKVSPIEELIRNFNKERLSGWTNNDIDFFKYKRRINKIIWKAPYTLPSDQQKIIETIKVFSKTPYAIFKKLRSTDFGGPIIKFNSGEETILNTNSFNQYKRNSDAEKRNKILREYFLHLKKEQDLYAKIIVERIKTDNTIAKLQNFENGMDALWYLLDGMPIGSYNTMLKSITDSQGTFDRYLKLKTKLLDIDSFNYYDFFAPLPQIEKDIPINEALEICIKASHWFGKDYQNNLRNRLKSSLFHLSHSKGKDNSFYGIFPAVGNAHSYTIMTYNNSMSSSSALSGAATLMMAWENIPEGFESDTGDDPGIYANSLIYLGNFLHDDYLYQKAKSKEERIAILSVTLERIWIRFFRYVLVTQWELEIQNNILEGKIPNGEDLSSNYLKVLRTFYSSIEIPEEVKTEWMTYRVPFYSFEHQFWPVAIAGACTVMNKLQNGDSDALNIMEVLGRGDLDMTHSLYKDAGIDMTSKQPYLEIMTRMNYLMDLLEKELN